MEEIRRSESKKRTLNVEDQQEDKIKAVDKKTKQRTLTNAKYYATQKAKEKRNASYNPGARQARHKATYDPAARKAAYNPEAQKAAYNPVARRASYVSQLPQWSLTNIDKIPQHTKVKQEWGYGADEKCPYCFCIFLRSQSASFRRKCCNSGDYCVYIPYLEPLLKSLRGVVNDEAALKDFTSSSTTYNNILALGEF